MLLRILILIFTIFLLSCGGTRKALVSEKEKNNFAEKREIDSKSKGQIINLIQWETETELFTCTVEKLSEGSVFKIRNMAGKDFYVDRRANFYSMSTDFILRDAEPQLIVTFDDGGSSLYWVKILDFKKGKILELTDESHTFEAGYYLKPQFQSSVKASQPYELHLFQGGINSPLEKEDCVYRYKNGKFQLVGNYSLSKLDNLIDDWLTESHKAK